tara:strand:- start:29414 stop:30361 length:948 start_codon:yes stop_codon:yes gene_type:complete
MKTHLITGAAGFIGSALSDKILSSGDSVVGIDNFLLGNLKSINDLKSKYKNFSFIEFDLSIEKNIQHLIKKLSNYNFDIVWHLAANSDIRGYENGLKVDFNNTFMTTINIGVVMENLGINEIVFSSSSAAIGNTDIAIAENYGPALPNSYYGSMKLASEGYISSLTSYCIKKYTIVRFPNVIGPKTTHGVIYDFVHKLKNKPEFLNVLGNGNQKKPYLYVDDVVDGLIYFQNKNFEHRVINLSPLDDGITVKEIANECIKQLSPKTKPKYQETEYGWFGDVPRYSYNYEKMLNLGFRPRYSSHESLVKVVEEIKN